MDDWLLRAAALGALSNPSVDALLEIIPNGRVNASELAHIIHRSYPTVLRMIKRGDVTAHRVGGVWSISAEEVYRLLTGNLGM